MANQPSRTSTGTAGTVRADCQPGVRHGRSDRAETGNQIDLDCRYTGYGDASTRLTYALQVIDRAGTTRDLGTWILQPGTGTTFISGTVLRRAQISSIQITVARHLGPATHDVSSGAVMGDRVLSAFRTMVAARLAALLRTARDTLASKEFR
jgi:hypothetical protein